MYVCTALSYFSSSRLHIFLGTQAQRTCPRSSIFYTSSSHSYPTRSELLLGDLHYQLTFILADHCPEPDASQDRGGRDGGHLPGFLGAEGSVDALGDGLDAVAAREWTHLVAAVGMECECECPLVELKSGDRMDPLCRGSNG